MTEARPDADQQPAPSDGVPGGKRTDDAPPDERREPKRPAKADKHHPPKPDLEGCYFLG